MIKRLSVAIILFAGMVQAWAQSSSLDLLQKASQKIDIASSLVMDQSWVRYPSYSDREGWKNFVGRYGGPLVARGEKFIDYGWIHISDADYLAYDLRGDRKAMEDKHYGNIEALSSLLVAELVEGQGRFLGDIIKGVVYFCDMPSWAVSAHLAKYQKCKSPIPDPSENILALYQGNISQMLSWTYYFLHSELEICQKGLSARLRQELQKKELDPYLQRDDFFWQGFTPVKGKKINNWNPWCNSNALICFMLLENDRETLSAAVNKSMQSVDYYINALSDDGACDEGTTYWYKSIGHLMDYLECLDMITGGRLSIWNEPLIRKCGEFIVNADMGDRWQVNFADGGPSRKPIVSTIYRYGRDCGSAVMQDFAVSSFKRYEYNPDEWDWALFYQGAEGVSALLEMNSLPDPGEFKRAGFVNYPNSQLCFMRKSKAFLAAKGGNNGESHNHNDVGTCIYFYDNNPVLVDAGSGTYTKDTFGDKRYTNWFTRSSWHNLPTINGADELYGASFRAGDTEVNKSQRKFAVNIAGAYSEDAGIESWTREYRLLNDGSLKIEDNFRIANPESANVLHFLVNESPLLIREGRIRVTDEICLEYDPDKFSASVDEKFIDGLGFSRRWGKSLYRINLNARHLEKKGSYTVTFKHRKQESVEDMAKRVAAIAKKQYVLMDRRLTDVEMPRTLNADSGVKDTGIGSWTSGFYPGCLWELYELSGGRTIKKMAEKQTAKIGSILSSPISHDIGFQVNCSYGNAYRITSDVKYLPLIEDASAALAARFNPNVGATLSWEAGVRGQFPVIIDNMMNLELLEKASKLFKCDSLEKIAIAHARTTRKNHFRPDYTTWHMLDYDPETGRVVRKVTVQGYSDDSAWARGQAWALYGYTMMFRETALPEFLQQAEKVAEMLLEKLPDDGIPYWDFNDPGIPDAYRDASAAAVMCSAFIELGTLTSDKALSEKCLKIAEKQIRTLAGNDYLATPGANGCFLLRHSVGNLPGNSEIDVPLIYADYYFLEALNRYLAL